MRGWRIEIDVARPSPVQWATLAVGVAPWTWFLVRDLDARFDAVALAWPVVGFGGAITLALASVGLRRVEPAGAAMSWLVATLVVVVLPWSPDASPPPVEAIRIVAANTHTTHTSSVAVTADIQRQRPGVVVAIEVSEDLDGELRDRYSYRLRRDDVAVYSSRRLTLREIAPAGQRGFVAELEGGVVLYALHLQKPGVSPSTVEVGFRTHRRIVDDIAEVVAAETKPVIVAGDLNLVDRTSGYRRLTRDLDDAMRADWSRPTSRRSTTRWLLARVDHIFMPESWCSDDSRVFDLRGSDHRGVAADVGPCRQRNR